jgi:transposase
MGIDISRDSLDAHRLETGEARQFANTPAGLRALRRWIAPAPPAR